MTIDKFLRNCRRFTNCFLAPPEGVVVPEILGLVYILNVRDILIIGRIKICIENQIFSAIMKYLIFNQSFNIRNPRISENLNIF